jgi:hypothetical protein
MDLPGLKLMRNLDSQLGLSNAANTVQNRLSMSTIG